MTAKKWVKTLSMHRKTRAAILHTRMWTQGRPENNDNNHPIRSGNVVGVHNGGIWNDDSLWDLLPEGSRQAEVDSEVIFALLDKGHDALKDVQGIAHDVDLLEYLTGSAAIAYMLEDEDPSIVHLARVSGSPLAVAQTDAGSLIFASLPEVIVEAADEAGLDITYMEREVKEGTYYKVKDGLIVESMAFEVPWGYSGRRMWNSPSSFHSTSAYTLDSYERYTWCEYHSDWFDQCACADEEESERLASVVNLHGDSGGEDKKSTFPEYLIEGAVFDPADPYMGYTDEAWGRLYKKRTETINDWLLTLEREEKYSDQDLLDVAKRAHAFVRPGDWVETEVMGEKVHAQVIEVPDTFPHGKYLLRVYLPISTDSFNGMEIVLVQRTASQFKEKSTSGRLSRRIETLGRQVGDRL